MQHHINQGNKQLKRAQVLLDDMRYYDINQSKAGLAVNIKIYEEYPASDWEDLNNIIDELTESTKVEKEQIKFNILNIGVLTWLEQMYTNYNEDQKQYFFEDFMNGCTINSKEYYEKEYQKANTGKEKRQIKMAEFIDRKEKEFLNLLEKEVYITGHSSGWAMIYSEKTLSHYIIDLEEEIEIIECNDKDTDFIDIPDQTDLPNFIKELKNILDAIEWIAELIKTTRKTYVPDLKHELKFRLQEMQDN